MHSWMDLSALAVHCDVKAFSPLSQKCQINTHHHFKGSPSMTLHLFVRTAHVCGLHINIKIMLWWKFCLGLPDQPKLVCGFSIVQISLSSLGSGRASPGLSTPWFLACLCSSALGWYDPSICCLLRRTHENRTKARVSRNNTGMNRPDTLSELMMLHTCTCENKHRLRISF